MTYKWGCPHEWLREKALSITDDGKLRELIFVIYNKLDDDTIQSIFSREMEQDGYFEEYSEDEELVVNSLNLNQELWDETLNRLLNDKTFRRYAARIMNEWVKTEWDLLFILDTGTQGIQANIISELEEHNG